MGSGMRMAGMKDRGAIRSFKKKVIDVSQCRVLECEEGKEM